MFGQIVGDDFAAYHVDFWEWVWQIEAGQPSRPFVAIWPRGFGKSSSVELACAALAARGARAYVMYVSGTQAQADTHLASVKKLLQSPTFLRHYPKVGTIAKTPQGVNEAWRRERMTTASGFTVDAIGLDTASRGAKLGDIRPDLFIIDDVDDRHDTPATVQKKIEHITESILPQQGAHSAVTVVQNVIHKNGIVARLADGRADFLADREVSGPHPALIDAQYAHDGKKWVISGGKPTWEARPIAVLQSTLDNIGLRAFKREEQHEVKDAEGALWTQERIDRTRETQRTKDDIPMARVVVGVDPPGSSRGAECGIVGAGRGHDRRGYVIGDFSLQGTPSEWGTAVIAAYDKLLADAVVVERNFGGDMVAHTLRTIRPNLNIIEVTASRGKDVRAEPISALYDNGMMAHVGYFPALEEEQTTWVPNGKAPSPNRLDAMVWAMTDLMLQQGEDTQIIVHDPYADAGYVISPV